MKSLFRLVIVPVIFFSCARIPIQSITLVDALTEEGKRMHDLNVALLSTLFKAKREKIDEFIKTEYSRQFIANFQKNMPAGVDLKAEMGSILNVAIPKINERRDAMQSALDEQKAKLLNRLEIDYKVFESASGELRRLLVSAADVNKANQALINKTKELTKGAVDLNALETTIDKFIRSGGTFGNQLSDLDDAIDSIIKK
jgi:hypothetical protein